MRQLALFAAAVFAADPYTCTAPHGARPRVLAIGNTFIDNVVTMPRFPSDGKVIVDSKIPYVGGQGANAVQAMAMLGLNVSFLTRLGDDASGTHARTTLEGLGVDMSPALVLPARTDSAVVVVQTETGQRSSLIDNDPALHARTSLSEAAASAWAAAANNFDVVYTDGWQLDLALPVARAASRAGVRLVVDVEALHHNDSEELAKLASDLISPTTIVQQLAKHDATDEALRILSAARADRVVVATDGAKGSHAARGGGPVLHQAAQTVVVRDTTGAGDSYHAGFVAAVARGLELQEAMELATRVAAAKCETPGPAVTEEALRRWGLWLAC